MVTSGGDRDVTGGDWHSARQRGSPPTPLTSFAIRAIATDTHAHARRRHTAVRASDMPRPSSSLLGQRPYNWTWADLAMIQEFEERERRAAAEALAGGERDENGNVRLPPDVVTLWDPINQRWRSTEELTAMGLTGAPGYSNEARTATAPGTEAGESPDPCE